MKVLSGTANPELAKKICKHLNFPLTDVLVSRFSDGEVKVKIKENIRGKDVFIVQPTCPPVNDNLMELLILIDAARRASAKRITAVLPYYGYARQDRKDQPRVPITAKLTANLITAAGASRVLTMDLHASQIQGFFDIPVDHLYAINVLCSYIQEKNLKDLVVLSPDVGGTKMARAYAKRLNANLAIIDKRRISSDKTEVLHVLGDVQDKSVVIVDDIVSTAGSLVESVVSLKKNQGVREVFAAITHGILAGPAITRIRECPDLKELIVSDSVPLLDSKKLPKIQVASAASLFAEAIQRIHDEESVSCLFTATS
jgi:ribose-phosphate pyrophosphokinase